MSEGQTASNAESPKPPSAQDTTEPAPAPKPQVAQDDHHGAKPVDRARATMSVEVSADRVMPFPTEWAEVRTLKGHTSAVQTVRFGADGKTLASGGSDGTVRFWDGDTGRQVWASRLGSRYVGQFSPDGSRFAETNVDRTITLWDTVKRERVWSSVACVQVLAFSPDGKRLVVNEVGPADQFADGRAPTRLWDMTTGKDVADLTGARGSVRFGPDSRRIVSTSAHQTGGLGLWDGHTGQRLGTLTGADRPLSFSPDGTRLLTSDQKDQIGLWDLTVGKLIRRFTDETGLLSFSPNSRRLLRQTPGGSLALWDASTGRKVRAPEEGLRLIGVSPNGRRFLTQSKGWHVAGLSTDGATLWDGVRMKKVRRLGARFHTVTFSPGGRRFAAQSADKGHIELWNADSGRRVRELKGANRPVTFSADGERVISAWYGDTSRATMTPITAGTRVWNAKSGRVICTLRGLSHDAVFSPNGKLLAAVSRDGKTAGVLSAATGKELWLLKPKDQTITGISFSPDSTLAMVTVPPSGFGAHEGGFPPTPSRPYDALTGRPVLWGGHLGGVRSLAASRDGRTLASGGDDSNVGMWDVRTGRCTAFSKKHGAPVTSVQFGPKGQRLASCASDRTIKLWHVAKQKQLWAAKAGQECVWSAAFSPDGSKLVTVSTSPLVKQWLEWADRTWVEARIGKIGAMSRSGGGSGLTQADPGNAAGNPNAALARRSSSYSSSSWSDMYQSYRLSTAGPAIEVWHAETGKKARSIAATAPSTAIAFGPDGEWFLAGCLDGTIRIWDAATGQEGRVLKGHDAMVMAVAVSPDGRQVASGSVDGLVRIWDVATGHELHALTGHADVVTSVCFSPDGRQLASGSLDATIKLWRWRLAETPKRLAVALRPGLGGMPKVKPTQNALGFAELYADVWRVVSRHSPEELKECFRANPGHARVLIREMLSECAYLGPLAEARLQQAERLADLYREVHGGKSLLDQVREAQRLTEEERRAARGLTFLAATQLLSAGEERIVREVVRVAPVYAGLFIAECLIPWWRGKLDSLPSDSPGVFRELAFRRRSPADVALQLGTAFAECHGDRWFASVARLFSETPDPGAPEYLAAGAIAAAKAAQWPKSVSADLVSQLRQTTEAALARGDYGAALARAEGNLAIVRRLSNRNAQHAAILDIAGVYRRIGDHDQALKLIARAEALETSAEAPKLVADTQTAKALVLQSAGRPDEAAALLHQARTAARAARDVEAECRCQVFLSLSLLARGENADAETEATNAIALARQHTLEEELPLALYALGCAQAALGHYQHGVQSLAASLGDREAGQAPSWSWHALFTIGRCHEQLADEQTARDRRLAYQWKARRNYDRALEAVEARRGTLAHEEHKAFLSEDKGELHDALIRLCLAQNLPSEAAAYAERFKSMAFLERLGPRTLARKRERLAHAAQTIRRAAAALEAEEPADKAVRDVVERELGAWPAREEEQLTQLRTLSKRYESSLRRLETADWGKAQNPFNVVLRSLKPGTAVIHYYLGEAFGCAFVVSRRGVWARRLSCAATDIAKGIATFRQVAIDSPTKESLLASSYEAALRDLYTALIAPLEGDLANVKTVYIVPHGMLHYLPFQALIAPDGQFLVEKVGIAYVPSLSVLRHCREANAGNKDSLFAAANPETGWEPLPATEKEARAVSALFKEKEVLFCEDATEQLVKKRAGHYDVLTFPTHGEMIWQNPTQSNLRFTPTEDEDGRWTVEEIFETDLKANLVTLSACETGLAGGYAGKLPQADDFVGLTRAFMYAGVPSVVGSLWKVADDSAVALMTAFFTNWKQKGMDKAEALRHAQLAMIKGDLKLGMVVRGPGGVAQIDSTKIETETNTKLGRHPYFWAPFVLIGDYK